MTDSVARVPSVGPDGLHRIPIDQYHVVEPPLWGDAPRSKNWLAVVDEDPQAPGGVRRRWCARGKGRFRYSIVDLLPDDLIEFGADYVSSGGHRYRDRWCATVVSVEEHALLVRHHSDLPTMLADAYQRRLQVSESLPEPPPSNSKPRVLGPPISLRRPEAP